jgi:hypothetical protein
MKPKDGEDHAIAIRFRFERVMVLALDIAFPAFYIPESTTG